MAELDRIPLARPRIGDRERELVEQVLASGMLSLGPKLREFERLFAERVGVAEAIATSSGTSALHLAVRGEGWGPGDRVLTTPLSFIASSNCLLFEDAEPLFCDIDPATLCMDPVAAGAEIDSAGVAGFLPVHIFGYPAAMPELEELAAGAGVGIVEDCAQAIGAVCSDGIQVGARGNSSAFAFYPNKQMTTGEGGALIPRDPDFAEVARSELNQGRSPEMAVMDHVRLGFNYRLSDLAAALGIAQLERLAGLAEARARIAARYTELLTSIGGAEPGAGDPDGLLLPLSDRGQARRSWFVYVVRLPSDLDRDGVIRALGDSGIDARPYLPCIHTSAFFRERFGYQGGEFPVAEEFSRRALALPFYPDLPSGAPERVVAALADALGRTPPG